jgi:hypothetical protein
MGHPSRNFTVTVAPGRIAGTFNDGMRVILQTNGGHTDRKHVDRGNPESTDRSVVSGTDLRHFEAGGIAACFEVECVRLLLVQSSDRSRKTGSWARSRDSRSIPVLLRSRGLNALMEGEVWTLQCMACMLRPTTTVLHGAQVEAPTCNSVPMRFTWKVYLLGSAAWDAVTVPPHKYRPHVYLSYFFSGSRPTMVPMQSAYTDGCMKQSVFRLGTRGLYV